MTRTARCTVVLPQGRPRSLQALTQAMDRFRRLSGSPVPGGIHAIKFVGYEDGQRAIYEARYPDAAYVSIP